MSSSNDIYLYNLKQPLLYNYFSLDDKRSLVFFFFFFFFFKFILNHSFTLLQFYIHRIG